MTRKVIVKYAHLEVLGSKAVIRGETTKGTPVTVELQDFDRYDARCGITKLGRYLASIVKFERGRHTKDAETLAEAWREVKNV